MFFKLFKILFLEKVHHFNLSIESDVIILIKRNLYVSDDSVKPKTWKGKIGKSFKKQFGSSPSPAGNIPTVQEVAGMFGVPLEDCTPSPNNEVSGVVFIPSTCNT